MTPEEIARDVAEAVRAALAENTKAIEKGRIATLVRNADRIGFRNAELEATIAALEADNARLRARVLEVLEQIMKPMECGCMPCTGQCRSKEALEITLEEIQEFARAAFRELRPAESEAAESTKDEA